MDGEVGEGECSGRTKDDLRINRGRGETDLMKEPLHSQPFVQGGKYLPIWLIAAHSSASTESLKKTPFRFAHSGRSRNLGLFILGSRDGGKCLSVCDLIMACPSLL